MCLRADEENESSSSEDEEEDRRRLNDELLGKVCSIESDEEPSSWYLALVRTHTHTHHKEMEKRPTAVTVCVHVQVVSPSCHDELLVKKDQCLVRAFSDSKL